jgi:flagellar biosynthesis chaperone FliJ
MPDSIEHRLAHLEQSNARLEQRVEDHENDIRAFAPLVASQAVLQEQMIQLRQAIDSLQKTMQASSAQLQAREESRVDYSTKRLVAIIGGSAAVIAAIITAAAMIVASAP